ncbi:hypothetical protein J2D78_01540 [Microbacterium maritypicum]|uniref:hypothetical protein n=1 Tax=Microbacterium maritypicum TaxID=33918 RepID=UPI001B31F2D7|nr:hypothetical protein [Microbacterium liquefaciens]MBP5800757.1 hypothetical protein [Microbacterium liquefaciens]
MTEQTGNNKPNEAEGLAFPLSGNEKLIEEAASKRYPHRDVFLEGGAYMAEERSRVPLREAFVEGAKWQAEVTEKELRTLCNVVKDYDVNFPCDGGCNVNDGPEETCSRHGRSPADLWNLLEADRAALAVFEKAHTPTDDEREDMIAFLLRDHNFEESPWGRTYTDAEIANALRRSEVVPEPSAHRVELAAATIAVAELVRTHRTWGDLLDAQKDEYRRVAREVLRATDALPVPTPSDLGYAEFEDWEQEMFRHQPVLSMTDGAIAGCQCLDRVFAKGREDWGKHLASVITARLLEPQGEPSGIPFYDQKMRELDAIRAQGEPSDERVNAALNAHRLSDLLNSGYGPERFHKAPDLSYWHPDYVSNMRAALRAAGVGGAQ